MPPAQILFRLLSLYITFASGKTLPRDVVKLSADFGLCPDGKRQNPQLSRPSTRRAGQCLIKIGNQIIGILDPD